MYYASVGIIALIVMIIINFEALRKVENTSSNEIRLKYRQYLLALLTFVGSDILWGAFYEQRWVILTSITTCLFFGSMALSVLLWTRCVVTFSGNNGKTGKLLVTSGWTVFLFEVAVLTVNLFYPIVFSFKENKEYLPLPARHIGLILQIILFLVTSVYSMVKALHSHKEKSFQYKTITASALIMSFFIIVQMYYPLMPFYSMGCLFSTCLIHTFIYKDRETEQKTAIALARQQAYKDGLTNVRNKLSYLEYLSDLENMVERGELKEYGVVVFDVNGLKMINDTLGHEAGDEYIKSACRIICIQFDHSPVFRIGGDEFVAILTGSDYDHREELLTSFRNIIDENIKNGAVIVASGLSIYHPQADCSFNDVFKRADEAMYEQKHALKIITEAAS